eukprot:g3935.t1
MLQLQPSLRPHPCTRQDIVKTGFKTGDQSGAISTSTFPDDRLGNAGATTLMVRNIPVRYTQDLFSWVDLSTKEICVFCESKALAILLRADGSCQEMLLKEWPNRGTYDFLYLPICIKKKCNTSFAFINFISSELAREFAQRWHHERLLFFSARKPLDISLADLQGLEKNLLQCMNNKSLFCSYTALGSTVCSSANSTQPRTSRIRNIRFQPAVFKGSERVSVESVMKDLREKLHPEYQYEDSAAVFAVEQVKMVDTSQSFEPSISSQSRLVAKIGLSGGVASERCGEARILASLPPHINIVGYYGNFYTVGKKKALDEVLGCFGQTGFRKPIRPEEFDSEYHQISHGKQCKECSFDE